MADQPQPSVCPKAHPEQEFSFEVWQDDQPVAWADGPLEAAWREACHYAAVYGQDGPVMIYKVTRTPIMLTDAPSPESAD